MSAGNGADVSATPYDARALARRVIPRERPRPIDIDALRQVRELRVCSWCFSPLGARRASFNGGIGHIACATRAHHAVLGDGAMPWVPGVETYRENQLKPFLERLAVTAARQGLDGKRLSRAIRDAYRG